MMRPTFVVRLNAFCVAMALSSPAIQAAERSPLLGLTQDQLIAQYGEPKSQILAGSRVIFFFAHERVVLRDGGVVQVDRLPEPAPAKPAPTPPPAEAPTPATTNTPDRTAPVTGTVAPTTAPATAPGATATPTPKAGPVATPVETPSEPAEPKFEIKSVHPSGSAGPRAQPKRETPPPPKAEPPAPVAVPTPAPQPVISQSTVPTAAAAPAATSPTAAASNSAPTTSVATPATVATVTPPAETEASKPETADAEKLEKEKTAAPAKKVAPRRAHAEPDLPDTAEIIDSKRNYVITFLVVASGVGYLVWRHRQRRLALEATAVSRTPFSAPVAAKAGGVVFTNDLLQKLEWKRFEELVASYYSKTGVVAQRTKSGPNAPVHIKISWKGEPRPFAYVQCLANPDGLIDVKPLQELVNVLAAEDIRRGYVVTTGKFNVNARDLAEEKHLTLLPGDIFLEKLNALPDAARAELMQQTTSGDYTTPSCPKCDAKMAKAIDDPTMWRCPNHPDQRIPV